MARMKNGQLVVNWASNDYLGLAHHPAITEAMIEGVKRFGAGSMASRLVTGTRSVHTELEERLAALKGAEAALSFSSGYATSVGTIGAIVHKGDIVILDKLSHASLIDGARLSGAELHTFLHNNVESLQKQLERFRAKDATKRILIVTESVFSMDGDRAPLREIAELKERYGALLLVDEAHAFGVLGEEGAGLASELGVSSQIDFQMGTLSKSAGLSGGYVACTRNWADVFINSSRSFIYSTAPAPALALAAIASVNLIAGDEGKRRRQHVRDMADLFTELMDYPQRPLSSIFPHVIGENNEALQAADHLMELGHLAPAIRYPTVPKGTARLRLTITAANSEEQVRSLAHALHTLKS
jgi:8-amino-7-oxononanoate synthase